MKAISPSARGWMRPAPRQAHRGAVVDEHAVGEEAEVGLEDAQHLLHRRLLVTPIFLPITRSPSASRSARKRCEMR
jgi:hypothetical protein